MIEKNTKANRRTKLLTLTVYLLVRPMVADTSPVCPTTGNNIPGGYLTTDLGSSPLRIPVGSSSSYIECRFPTTGNLQADCSGFVQRPTLCVNGGLGSLVLEPGRREALLLSWNGSDYVSNPRLPLKAFRSGETDIVVVSVPAGSKSVYRRAGGGPGIYELLSDEQATADGRGLVVTYNESGYTTSTPDARSVSYEPQNQNLTERYRFEGRRADGDATSQDFYEQDGGYVLEDAQTGVKVVYGKILQGLIPLSRLTYTWPSGGGEVVVYGPNVGEVFVTPVVVSGNGLPTPAPEGSTKFSYRKVASGDVTVTIEQLASKLRTSLLYDATNQIKQLTDATGARVTNQYNGRLLRMTTTIRGGEVVTENFGYDTQTGVSNSSVLTSPNGNVQSSCSVAPNGLPSSCTKRVNGVTVETVQITGVAATAEGAFATAFTVTDPITGVTASTTKSGERAYRTIDSFGNIQEESFDVNGNPTFRQFTAKANGGSSMIQTYRVTGYKGAVPVSTEVVDNLNGDSKRTTTSLKTNSPTSFEASITGPFSSSKTVYNLNNDGESRIVSESRDPNMSVTETQVIPPGGANASSELTGTYGGVRIYKRQSCRDPFGEDCYSNGDFGSQQFSDNVRIR